MSEAPLYAMTREGDRVLKRACLCRANSAKLKQSRPDSGLGFQVKALKTLPGVPSSLGSGLQILLVIAIVRNPRRTLHKRVGHASRPSMQAFRAKSLLVRKHQACLAWLGLIPAAFARPWLKAVAPLSRGDLALLVRGEPAAEGARAAPGGWVGGREGTQRLRAVPLSRRRRANVASARRRTCGRERSPGSAILSILRPSHRFSIAAHKRIILVYSYTW